MPKRYPPEVIAECKQLYIYDNWSPRKISEFLDGEPHWQTIRNWAERKNSEGKDWDDERQDYIDSIVNQITPQKISQLYTKKIYEVLTDPNFSQGSSDALAKLQKNYEKVTDPSNRIPVIYGMLTELINFIKNYHNDVMSEDFLNALRDFKNYQRNKLQN